MSFAKILVFLIGFSLSCFAFAGRGCCSWHGGVSGCDSESGRLVCNDSTYSPSCGCPKKVSNQNILESKKTSDIYYGNVRLILVDNLPKFRFCYQNSIKSTGRTLSGIVKINFVITPSGYVSQAGVDTEIDHPYSTIKCLINVLKGIQFIEPFNGEAVEVSQPFNFYPVKID